MYNNLSKSRGGALVFEVGYHTSPGVITLKSGTGMCGP